MAQVEFSERQLTLKLVYFGPPRSGKTTNLQTLHARIGAVHRGRLMTLDTRDDRTLFFDLLPIFFQSSSLSFRIRVYTVPGQQMHESTRRLVLQGADGVVFVADSSVDKAEVNRESWLGLRKNLVDLGLRVPVIVQYNKRDLADAVTLGDADRFDDAERSLYPASALTGEGVLETFVATLRATWDQLDLATRLGQRFGPARDAFLRTVCGDVGFGERGSITR